MNLALISLIWNNGEFRASFIDTRDFNTSQLYHDVVIWLGKRYFAKFEQRDPDDIFAENILESDEVQFLIKVAYQSLVETGKLVTNKVVKEHIGKLDLRKVVKLGLLKPERDSKDIVKNNYQFIHLTFQEYLTAYHIKELLSQEGQVREIATWMAHHRHDPKYLMTFKFLAGLVSQAEGLRSERLVQSFWEAASCNVDGVLELGIEEKINLFMHLLSQSKVKGELDRRIPNLAKIRTLIDGEVCKDLAKWQVQLLESGYLSSSRTRTRAWGNARHTRTRRRHRMPMAPALATALPGRSTAVARYCSGSSLKLKKPTTGK